MGIKNKQMVSSEFDQVKGRGRKTVLVIHMMKL